MKNNKGFSLLELLVVVAILGILIIAILSSIDPLEQIRKARDAGRLADAGQLLGAYSRYFVTHKCYPWYAGAPDCTDDEDARLDSATLPDFSETGSDYGLISDGQLKIQFPNRRSIVNGELYVSTDAEKHVSLCFEPESKKYRGGHNLAPLMDNINRNRIPGSSCDNVSGYPDGSCYVCVPM